MKPPLLISLLLLAAAPNEVVVGQGESLSQVARRALGDERGASELKALNGITDEKVAPGTTLKLPGPDRDQALKALSSARSAINQAHSDKARQKEALAKLQEAESHFQGARYKEAAEAADGAWKLAWNSSEGSRFQVAVNGDTTTVVAIKGPPVRVENSAGNRQLAPGERVEVKKGQAPPPPPPPVPTLLPPSPLKPEEDTRLKLKADKRGNLGPVLLSWQPVEGAEQYELELVPAKGEPRTLTVSATQTRVALREGRYTWKVRALAQGARSEPSAERSFELQEKEIRLDVKGTGWK